MSSLQNARTNDESRNQSPTTTITRNDSFSSSLFASTSSASSDLLGFLFFFSHLFDEMPRAPARPLRDVLQAPQIPIRTNYQYRIQVNLLWFLRNYVNLFLAAGIIACVFLPYLTVALVLATCLHVLKTTQERKTDKKHDDVDGEGVDDNKDKGIFRLGNFLKLAQFVCVCFLIYFYGFFKLVAAFIVPFISVCLHATFTPYHDAASREYEEYYNRRVLAEQQAPKNNNKNNNKVGNTETVPKKRKVVSSTSKENLPSSKKSSEKSDENKKQADAAAGGGHDKENHIMTPLNLTQDGDANHVNNSSGLLSNDKNKKSSFRQDSNVATNEKENAERLGVKSGSSDSNMMLLSSTSISKKQVATNNNVMTSSQYSVGNANGNQYGSKQQLLPAKLVSNENSSSKNNSSKFTSTTTTSRKHQTANSNNNTTPTAVTPTNPRGFEKASPMVGAGSNSSLSSATPTVRPQTPVRRWQPTASTADSSRSTKNNNTPLKASKRRNNNNNRNRDANSSSSNSSSSSASDSD